MTLQSVTDADAWGNGAQRVVAVRVRGCYEWSARALRELAGELRLRPGESVDSFVDEECWPVVVLRGAGVTDYDVKPMGRYVNSRGVAAALRAAMDMKS